MPDVAEGSRTAAGESRAAHDRTVDEAVLVDADPAATIEYATTSANADSAAQMDLPLDEPAAVDDIRADAADVPTFVREAERAARWRRPWVRAALGLGCIAAGLALCAQVLLGWRDQVAAHWPRLQAAVTLVCPAPECRAQAPRSLEGLRVESSGLVRVERSDLYRLSVALRNQQSHDTAMPALELSLTDTQGQLIARRVLRTADLGAGGVSLGAGSELTLQALLRVGAAPVAGYTIELFYP